MAPIRHKKRLSTPKNITAPPNYHCVPKLKVIGGHPIDRCIVGRVMFRSTLASRRHCGRHVGARKTTVGGRCRDSDRHKRCRSVFERSAAARRSAYGVRAARSCSHAEHAVHRTVSVTTSSVISESHPGRGEEMWFSFAVEAVLRPRVRRSVAAWCHGRPRNAAFTSNKNMMSISCKRCRRRPWPSAWPHGHKEDRRRPAGAKFRHSTSPLDGDIMAGRRRAIPLRTLRDTSNVPSHSFRGHLGAATAPLEEPASVSRTFPGVDGGAR